MSDETMRLIPLSEAREYTLNESMPDVRGWSVEASDGEVVGEVRELIVDRDAGRVRYLEVELSATFAGGAGHRVLVPVELASADDDDDVVRVLTVTSGDVRGLEAYDHEHFDERRMVAGRRVDDDDRDFSYLLGVGGAMTESDVHPEIVGELGAGEMQIPVVQEETRPSVAPEDT